MYRTDRKDCSNCKFQKREAIDFPCINCQNTKEHRSEEYQNTPLMWEAVPAESSSVNHPSHYNQGKYECLDVMIDIFGAEAVQTFCLLNAFKYTWRSKQKNGMEDIQKAQFYLNKYEELESYGK